MNSNPPYLQEIWKNEPGKVDWGKKAERLRQLLTEHPENQAEILLNLMMVLNLADKADECIEVSLRLLEMPEMESQADEMYTCLARSYFQKLDYVKAKKYYDMLLEIEPEDEEALKSLGEIYERGGEWDKAYEYYDRYQNSDLEWAKAEALNCKATMYFRQKQFDKALNYFIQGLEHHPKDTRFVHGIGICHAGKQDFDTAMQWFSKELELEPGCAEAYYSIGLCWQSKGDFYRAIHNYMEALKHQPNYPEAYNNLAKLFLEEEGSIQKAIEMLEKSIETAGDAKHKGLFYLNLSKVYRKIADYDKADYYKAKFLDSMGFDVEWREGDEDDDEYDDTQLN